MSSRTALALAILASTALAHAQPAPPDPWAPPAAPAAPDPAPADPAPPDPAPNTSPAPEPAPAALPAPPDPAPAITPPSSPAAATATTTAAAATKPAPRFPFLPAPDRRNYVGIEVGAVRAADPRNVFGDGPGKTVVIGIRHWETRVYERYDLEDRTGVYGDAEGVRGRLSITSFGRRLAMAYGPIALRALVGAAWIRRPLIDGEGLRSQHGLAAMLGAGVQLGPFMVEARAYPTMWQDLTGEPRFIHGDTGLEAEAIMDLGGMPLTVNAGVGISF